MKRLNKTAVILLVMGSFVSGCVAYAPIGPQPYGYGAQPYYGYRGGYYRGSKYRSPQEWARGQCTQYGIGCPRRW